MLRQLLEVLVLPPVSAIVALLLGSALRWWKPRLGRWLQVLGVAWIWAVARGLEVA